MTVIGPFIGLTAIGGLFAIHNSFSSEHITTNCNDVFEHSFVKVAIDKHNFFTLYIGVFYMPPVLAMLFIVTYRVLRDSNRPKIRFIVDESHICLLPLNFLGTGLPTRMEIV